MTSVRRAPNVGFMTPSSASPAAPRRTGRPRGRFNPDIDWDLARKLLDEGGLSLSEIATRVGTSKQNLHQHSKRWANRQGDVVAAVPRSKRARAGGRPRPAPVAIEDGGEAPGRGSKPQVNGNAEVILRAYVELFADAIESKTIRHDSLADLDRAVRLLAYVRGQVESIKATHTTLSLEVLQRRHAEMRAVAQDMDDAVAGVIGIEARSDRE